jgi:TPR repeat protein
MQELESIIKLESADKIGMWDPEEEELMQQKRETYETLAGKDSGEAGRSAQLRMAIIWHNGLFGCEKSAYKAIPYWTALSSQKDDPAMCALALEMLGVYHKEGLQSLGARVKPNLAKAKDYFIRAGQASDDHEVKKRLLEEVLIINQNLLN